VIHVVDGGDAWSAYLRRMTSREGWSVARLARESEISRSTIFRWIAEGAEAVTVASVIAIADALGDTRANAIRAAANLPVDRDPEVDLILNSDLSEEVKVRMIDRLMIRREEERQRRLADLEWMLSRGTGEAG
jgi:transcriptional regulator with XRE-family HTH domain